jgi:hypothetical protein
MGERERERRERGGRERQREEGCVKACLPAISFPAVALAHVCLTSCFNSLLTQMQRGRRLKMERAAGPNKQGNA